MRLILIRHGQTEGNANEIIQGHLPGKLSKKGQEQAKALGHRLKNEKIDFIYSSDLHRVRETIAPVIIHHAHVQVVYTPELRERNYGGLEGKTFADYKNFRESTGKKRHEFTPENGESYVQLRKRAEVFLMKIAEKHKGKTVLLAAHGSYNTMLLSLVLDHSIEDALEIIDQENTCVNIVDLSNPKKPKAELINCTTHLNKELRSPGLERLRKPNSNE